MVLQNSVGFVPALCCASSHQTAQCLAMILTNMFPNASSLFESARKMSTVAAMMS